MSWKFGKDNSCLENKIECLAVNARDSGAKAEKALIELHEVKRRIGCIDAKVECMYASVRGRVIDSLVHRVDTVMNKETELRKTIEAQSEIIDELTDAVESLIDRVEALERHKDITINIVNNSDDSKISLEKGE